MTSSRPTTRVSSAGKLPASSVPFGAAVADSVFSRVTGAIKA
jgi:hypothetical protein